MCSARKYLDPVGLLSLQLLFVTLSVITFGDVSDVCGICRVNDVFRDDDGVGKLHAHGVCKDFDPQHSSKILNCVGKFVFEFFCIAHVLLDDRLVQVCGTRGVQ